MVAVGFPLLMCGGCGVVTLAMRPGHDATQMWLGAVVIVVVLAALPFILARINKNKRGK